MNRSGRGGSTRESAVATMANDAASIAKAPPTPSDPTSTPPTAGPAILTTCDHSPIVASTATYIGLRTYR